MKVELVRSLIPSPAELGKMLGICYGHDDYNVKRYCTAIKNGHHGILEHVFFTFKISDVSKLVTHELVRHRLMSYLQRSDRRAPKVTPSTAMLDMFTDIPMEMLDIEEKYLSDAHMNCRKDREKNQYFRPTGMSTELYISGNLRVIREMLEKRMCHRFVKKEFLQIASDIYNLIHEIDPLYTIYMVGGSGRCPNKCRNCSIPVTTEQDFTGNNIYLISGLMRSGKSAAASMLGVPVYPLASILKVAQDIMYPGEEKNRKFLQVLGTDIGRNLISDRIWVDTQLKAIHGLWSWAVDDLRFINELEAYRERYGERVVHIHIDAPDYARAARGSIEGSGHASELDCNKLMELADHVIVNDGLMEYLKEEIESIKEAHSK